MPTAEESAQGGLPGGRWGSRGSSAGPRGENVGCGENVEVVGPCIGVGAPGRRSIIMNPSMSVMTTDVNSHTWK